MKDDLRIDKEYQDLFFLNEARLRKIVEIVQIYSNRKPEIDTEIIFEIVHKDKSVYQTDEFENVLSDENIIGKEISSIKITLRAVEENLKWLNPICFVKFAVGEPENKYCFNENSIVFKIYDSDKVWAFSLSEELDFYIKRTLNRSQRNILNILDWIDTIFPILIFCLGLLLFISFYPKVNIKVGELTLLQILIGAPVLIIILSLLYSVFETVAPFTKLSRMLQGASVFYFGSQKEIVDKRKKKINRITWIVVVAFLISLVIGLIVSLTM